LAALGGANGCTIQWPSAAGPASLMKISSEHQFKQTIFMSSFCAATSRATVAAGLETFWMMMYLAP